MKNLQLLKEEFQRKLAHIEKRKRIAEFCDDLLLLDSLLSAEDELISLIEEIDILLRVQAYADKRAA